ncbi:MAG: AAA family ATPase [Actinomycetota bacterium]|nr:AAA family ATPase [Actinomycetota bacterium]
MACPSCGKELPGEFPFCPFCGSALTEARPAPAREERKVVTCLFCDLVGFTSRAEAMDPEDVRALLSPYHAHLRSELERFGGTVEKFIGDAVMALFGAPVAHEDDPERAVRAALAIRDWAREREDLQVRLGVTTGEALIRLDAQPGETTAAGDVVNTASRLQSGAPENGILVDETTYHATDQAIDYEQAEPVEAKGKAERVPAWEALEARSRVGVEAFETGAPLVGRRRELDVLLDAFTRARSENEPQCVTLVGVPGIGKSRLVYEFFRQGVQADSELIYWRHGRCPPYGDGVTYWAVAEMVKAQAGILETDAAEEAGAKLARAVEAAVGDEARWVLANLRPLVGLGEADEVSQDRQNEAFAAWRRFFEGLAEARPLVLVFEDLHWADEGLLDFVDHLVEWASGVPLLVVCTARPELLDRRPGWGGGKLNVTTLRVAALSDDDAAQLVADLIGRAVLPAETQAALLMHAGGNPLYAEQYARMLAERDSVEDLPLPENVQGLIAARLDLLSPEEKALLQDAAVIGRTFWPAALRAIGTGDSVDRTLHALERKEFVRRERRSAVGGEAEYAFRHVLVRDVAYGQIPRAERAEKHRRTAEWIESLGRAEDHAEMLAHHYFSALELARAAGLEDDLLVERARGALREAGARATALNAFGQAARFYERALELAPDESERAELLFRQGRAQYLAVGEGGREPLERALEALRRGDRTSAAEAESILAELDFQQGRHDLARERHERARRLVDDAPPSRAKGFVFAQYARFLMTAGDEEAIAVGREALEIAKTLGAPDLRSFALNVVGAARSIAGDAGGFDDLEQGLAIALEADVPSEILRGYNNLAASLGNYGDLRRCSTLHARGREAAERFGYLFRIRWFKAEGVYDDYVSGRWDEAVRSADEFVEAGELPYLEPMCLWVRGTILVARGEAERGLDDTARALELARTIKDPQILFPALAYHAAALVSAGRLDEAARVADELLRLWQEWRTMFPPSDWVAQLAGALAAVGRSDDFLEAAGTTDLRTRWLDAAGAVAAGDFADAADVYAGIGSLPDEALARLGAGSEAEVRQALSFYRSVGATRYIQQGEALLTASA